MTTKNFDARREAFEAWFNYNYKWFIANGHYGYTLERHEDTPFQYVQDQPHHDWRVWQAALDSICVELPFAHVVDEMQEGAWTAYDSEKVKQALTVAGDSYK